ncbi:hypothetical protein CAPTEDRAFT_168477 [Capitella teleta]|uniref:Protein farnesyltransferase subunit beta n=1 Tax=Capitella teleta TaxID=283909 RepID=R7UM01_CAPTE|nr:hypothetical protein CAPTEDRAFT_168477 [Capitella teleta]|eukprot:ELU07098.1 hypothetical protein CAPTEDRAFT_168477 [Capitella teleta]
MASSFRCTDPCLHLFHAGDCGLPTSSSREQKATEDIVANCFRYFKNCLDIETDIPMLHRRKHEAFLMKGLQHLSESYECLDASRPWLCYWILHSLELLSIDLPEGMASQVAQFLAKCQCPDGGFAGGPGQLAHLAPTYAAVNALCIIGTDEAFKVIDRPALQRYLLRMRTPEGAFKMHEGGEVDIRGAYCAASAARLTNVATKAMFDGTAEWVVSCQTYEGGFAGEPGLEAHGGYSFCGLAALVLLGHERLCDISALLRWTANRQMAFEGGFQGRTNKLVDGCYSFWQGGAFPLMHMILSKEKDDTLSADSWMFHQGALQEYLLICCQHQGGGLIDKPGKPRDFYHTCYCLSGLSVAQHLTEGRLEHTQVTGCASNEVKRTHPVFNIGLDSVLSAHAFFEALPVP